MSEIRCPSCSMVNEVGDAAPETQIACEGCDAPMIVPPAAPPAPPRAQGLLCVLGSPGTGAVRALWVGLLLIVISFAVKQVIISWAMWNAGTALEEPRLEVKRSAEIAQLDDDDQDYRRRREEIHDYYRQKRDELAGESAGAAASALLKLQWYCYLKLFLDLLRLAGAVFVLFSALHIVVDRSQGTWIKAYGVVCAGVALLVVVLGGLVTLIG